MIIHYQKWNYKNEDQSVYEKQTSMNCPCLTSQMIFYLCRYRWWQWATSVWLPLPLLTAGQCQTATLSTPWSLHKLHLCHDQPPLLSQNSLENELPVIKFQLCINQPPFNTVAEFPETQTARIFTSAIIELYLYCDRLSWRANIQMYPAHFRRLTHTGAPGKCNTESVI